jgi:hypothetical protein
MAEAESNRKVDAFDSILYWGGKWKKKGASELAVTVMHKL